MSKKKVPQQAHVNYLIDETGAETWLLVVVVVVVEDDKQDKQAEVEQAAERERRRRGRSGWPAVSH